MGRTHTGLGLFCFQGAKSLALGQIRRVRGLQSGMQALSPGRFLPVEIAIGGENDGLVEQNPIGNAAPQSSRHDRSVVRETIRGLAVRPASRLLQGLRQIPRYRVSKGRILASSSASTRRR